MARQSAGTSTLRRHLRVLDAFDALHPFRTLTQLSNATGIPLSTLHRLVAELTAEGLLERLPDRSYRLGVRLWEYASRTPGALGLREIARPWLHAAHSRIRQHVQLGVPAGTDVLFVERLSARDAVINATLIGGRLPMHASASGLVLLAFGDDATVQSLCAGGLHTYTSATIHTEVALRAALARVRVTALADTPGHIHDEARALAVPVPGPDGTVYAALSAVLPNRDDPEHAVIETLRVAAAGIARSLADAYARGGSTSGRIADAGVSPRSWEYIAALAGAREAAPLTLS